MNLFLEACIDSWSNFVSYLRDSFATLNHFTINQLRYIRSYIAELVNSSQPTNATPQFYRVQAILYDICPELTVDQLLNTLRATSAADQTEIQPTHTENFLIRTDILDLNSAWREFLQQENSSSSIAVTTKQLSFRHLCMIFSELNKNNIFKDISRRIPGYLNQTNREPSLIICSQRDQIKIVLSMYAYDSNAPMPTNQELLYCDASTTYEEVEIFVRRAFVSSGKRIYTMLNVQDLSYECANKLENSYHRLKNGAGDFVLAVVCCSERQADSIVASLFLNNRVRPVELKEQDLVSYLKRNLIDETNPFQKYEK